VANQGDQRSVLPPAQALPVTFGSLLDFPRDPLLCMRRLYRSHGPLAALEQDGQRLVFAFGPEYCQQVLSDARTFHSHFSAVRGPKNSPQRRLTCGLLSMNGEEHKRHRRLVMGTFQRKSLEGFFPGLLGLAREMAREWRTGQTRNVYHDMTRYMLRVTASLLFGFDVRELAYEIGDLMEHWMSLNHVVGIGAFVPDEAVSSSYDDLLTVAGALEQKILAMIAYRRSAEPGNDLLSQLLRAQDEAGVGLTDAELIGQTTVLFGAAHLTTANTLTWTLFLLAQHPHAAAELADELAGVLHGRAPGPEHLEQLPVLDRVLKESMRVLPASAYSHRLSAEPVDLGPLRLRKGTPVIFSQIITHHLPELFPDPEHFRPERWRTITPSPYAYFPFAAGPRMCVGAGLALMTLKITLAVLLQQHHLSVVPGTAINPTVSATMLKPTSGVPMQLFPPTAPFTNVRVEGTIHDLVALPGAVMPHRRRAA
jgi:cytochrome P450